MRNRDQGLGIRDQIALSLDTHECFGCGELTTGKYRDLPLCVQCQQECTLLNTLYALPPEPPAAAKLTLVRLAAKRCVDFVEVWRWIPELAFIVGVLVWLGALYGRAMVEWIEMGGLQ